jgi:hypothetical protein
VPEFASTLAFAFAWKNFLEDKPMKSNIPASVLLAFALVACGGGGGDATPISGSSPAPSPAPAPGPAPSPGPAPAPAPAAATSYEALVTTASRSDFLTQLNNQGTKGFNYFGPNILGGAGFNLYAKDSSTTFSYEILDTQTTAATFVAQLNAQGARGFDFYGPTTVGTIYAKESNAANNTFEVLAAPASAAGFLSQANAQGDKGFLYLGPYSLGNIYGKSSSGNAKYTYRLAAQPATHDALVTQANAQGLEGYKFGGLEILSGDPAGAFLNIYVKDTAQAAKFQWKTNPAATSAASLLTQANTEGAANFVYWFSVVLGTTTREVYFKPTSCTGVLCRGTSPL